MKREKTKTGMAPPDGAHESREIDQTEGIPVSPIPVDEEVPNSASHSPSIFGFSKHTAQERITT
jgi:hypothetical protein